MNHILITTALQAEARPLIDHFQLEQKQLNKEIFYYQKGEIICLTTGVGEKNVHNRLGTFLHETNSSNSILLNIGIAGGNKEHTEIGRMYMVNKITGNNGKVWLPDILLKTGLPEIPLNTVSKGITDGGHIYDGLVDMEAAAIFETAVQCLPVHRLIILKIVSDHMDVVLDSSEQVIPLMTKQLPEIKRIIEILKNSNLVKEPLLSNANKNLLNELSTSLKLTTTQSHQLRDKVEGYVVLKSGDISFLSLYDDSVVNSKQERTKIFHEICSRLSA